MRVLLFFGKHNFARNRNTHYQLINRHRKMKTRNPFFVFIIVLLIVGSGVATSCGSSSNSQGKKGNISISGAFALYPMTVKWAEVYKIQNPNVRISISAGGAGKGLVDAMSGMIDFGMFSRHLTQAEIDKGIWWISVVQDAVVPTINSKNPAYQDIARQGIKVETLKNLFLQNKKMRFGDFTGNKSQTNEVTVYTRSDACGAGEMWANFLGVNQENLEGIGVFGDPGIADAVKNDINGIGFNNIIYAYDIHSGLPYEGLKVMPIDMNANGKLDPEENFYNTLSEIDEAISKGKYPSPPARELYFVAKEKPTNPIVIEFLKWILTEGQQYVKEAGYVPLDQETIAKELAKLN